MEKEDHDIAETYRARLLAEAESIHRRVTWLATLQGFLFAGVAIGWKSPDSKILCEVLGFLGLTVALLVYFSFIGPVMSVRRTWDHWLSHKPKDYDGLDIFGWFPEKAPWTMWITPENLIPLAFAGAWFVLLLYMK